MVHRPRIIPPLTEKSSYLLLYFGAMIALIFPLWLILDEANAICASRWYVKLFVIGAETSLILAPYWVLPRRYRLLVFIPLFFIGLWLIASIWYFRFWNDFPTIYAITLTSNFNTELFRSLPELWKPSDIFAIIPAVCLLIVYIFKLRYGAESFVLSTKRRVIAIVTSIILFLGAHGVITLSKINYLRSNDIKVPYSSFSTYFIEHFYPDIWLNIGDLRSRGIVIALLQQCKDAYELQNLRSKLTIAENDAIENFINDSSFPPVLSDSLRNENSHKNIIILIVESLNSSVISDSITPTLSSLMRKPGSLSALNISTQIGAGGSGDGQLLANTGILPLTKFSTSVALGSSTVFPSLAHLTSRNQQIAIFADGATAWNERSTFESYGFEPIYCDKDFSALISNLGADLATITFANSIIPTLQEPFLMEILTSSMHIPFVDPNVPDSLYAYHLTNPDPVMQNYIRVVNYFDYSLSRLINKLEALNIYDNTLLFIVSDHPQNITSTDSDLPQMAFIAVNCGVSGLIEQPRLQSDVFPTILQLAGVGDSVAWKGAGTSMLGPEQTAERKGLGREISELILRGDFFRGKICTE